MIDSFNAILTLSSTRALCKAATVLTVLTTLPLLSEAKDTGSKGPLIAYVGTYSSPLMNVKATQVDLPPGNGLGIHLFKVDRATGVMTSAGVYAMNTSPSCLAINADKTRLYSANETEKMDTDDPGTISAFSINPADGQLTLLNTVRSGGAGPTNVSLHPSGKFLLVANYFGGSVSVLPILPDGKIGPPSDVKVDKGTVGPTKATNAPPGSCAFSGHDQTHAHMIETDPSGHFVLSTDLGLDQILIWKFDDKAGKLIANDPPSFSLPPGDGPRHFAFHPNQHWFYSLQEEGSNIVLFDFDSTKGTLTPRQTLSSLPPGYAGSDFTSEIMVSSDGKFVYAANRLHDSISWFSVGKTGELKYLNEEWTHGDYPRYFTTDPTGTFLYSCNQRADHIAIFHVDKKTGALKFTGHYTPVGNPSIIVFLDLAKKE